MYEFLMRFKTPFGGVFGIMVGGSSTSTANRMSDPGFLRPHVFPTDQQLKPPCPK